VLLETVVGLKDPDPNAPGPEPEPEGVMVPGVPGVGVAGVEVEEPNTILLVDEKSREPRRLLFEYCHKSGTLHKPPK
jgi:hypothetical protein